MQTFKLAVIAATVAASLLCPFMAEADASQQYMPYGQPLETVSQASMFLGAIKLFEEGVPTAKKQLQEIANAENCQAKVGSTYEQIQQMVVLALGIHVLNQIYNTPKPEPTVNRAKVSDETRTQLLGILKTIESSHNEIKHQVENLSHQEGKCSPVIIELIGRHIQKIEGQMKLAKTVKVTPWRGKPQGPEMPSAQRIAK